MKIFAIRDEEMRPIRNLAYLFYYERQKQFYIEIPTSVDPWDLPMILFNFARKGMYTLDAEWSRVWVSQRIIPTDRQNLGQILKDNGLNEYDEYKLLLLCHGRCAQDNCYISEIKEQGLPEEIRKRKQYKVNAVLPVPRGQMIVFFQNGDAKLCDIGQMTKDNPRYRRLLAYYEEFRHARILAGGYGVQWDAGQNIDDKTLYTKGTILPFSLEDFRSCLQYGLLDAQGAAESLGCSRQYINMLVKDGRVQPILQAEKSTIFLRSDIETLQTLN